ncbi:tryptase-like [Amphibalanus amphitrite]|uniref:tryptase-like n=1 Tax=Amphibalanus amphitrite TaxID=1232801 RepID=UPI001C9197E7|nr:tryptase-like [Amphibalanus amphitrite]
MALLVFICLTVGIAASALPSSAASVPLRQEQPAEKHVCPELAGAPGAHKLSREAKHICLSQEDVIIPKPKADTTAAAFKLCGNLEDESKTSRLSRGKYVLQSPNYPVNYSAKTNISWSFTADAGNIISIVCSDFDVEGVNGYCMYDWLDINGKHFCGKNAAVSVSAESLNVQFISDKSVNKKGFNCNIVVMGIPSPGGDSDGNCTCGQVNRAVRIVGGTETEENEYPWQAGVWPEFGDRVFICGGSVINNRYVLTAAHCVENNPTEVTVRLGNVRRNPTSSEEVFRVSLILVHPQRNEETSLYDFALLQLDRPISFSSHISPVCLPTPGETYAGLMATATGLGDLSNSGPLADAMMEVDLPILSPEACAAFMARVGLSYDGSAMVCAGGTAGEDTCAGDSGGPLVVDVGGRYVLVGVTSFGVGECATTRPALYARVTGVLEWISENTADSTYCS